MSALFRTAPAKGQSGLFNPSFKRAFRRASVKRSLTKSKLPAATAKVVRALVKREIAKDEEQKALEVSIIYQTTVTDSSTGPATAIALGCAPAQGTDVGQRLGDQIKIKKAFLKIAAIQNGGAVVIGPTYLSIWIARARATPTTSPSFGQYSNLKNSYTTAGGFSMEQSDQPSSFYTSVDEDQWEVAWHGNALIGLAQPSVATGLHTNNDSSIYREWEVDLTSKFKAKSRFAGTNSLTNNSWFLFAFAYEIGAAPTASAVYPLIRGALTYKYVDA